jgi:hypothetical protein
MSRLVGILVGVALSSSLIGSIGLWLYMEGQLYFPSDESATNFYMQLDSISKFSFVAAFYISLKERDTLKRLVFLALAFTFSEVLDELFFDPTRMQLNEIFILVISTIYVLVWRKNTIF